MGVFRHIENTISILPKMPSSTYIMTANNSHTKIWVISTQAKEYTDTLPNYLPETSVSSVEKTQKLLVRNQICKENSQNLYITNPIGKENSKFLYMSCFTFPFSLFSFH